VIQCHNSCSHGVGESIRRSKMEFSVSTFEELLTAMTMMQKNNKSKWMDPSYDWGQSGG